MLGLSLTRIIATSLNLICYTVRKKKENERIETEEESDYKILEHKQKLFHFLICTQLNPVVQ